MPSRRASRHCRTCSARNCTEKMTTDAISAPSTSGEPKLNTQVHQTPLLPFIVAAGRQVGQVGIRMRCNRGRGLRAREQALAR